ncbi:Copper-resistance protein CopA [Novosphingobium aromaticivorans DSM 12444]|uniref:Copper-resistance protein CopA n=1 Tax=Novosphingobium aromaticivorans (strain ATCC 700278 / DSM 12444 / CCUG 56034 / CIP 105152 / NBRC 16084 / F199) TaxID=279238 RepID=Q2G459_NOVAD|nr:copper resistance system multicopper oxidase [Novosphingobium aromaticivorans]ABD27364.1 Copper-resistance protein CopA [Novosphingobium aromaticivorans DSM 12444]SCY67887.1 L-ascorbate oxidase [Novosphingobium aromaticivorans]
MDKNLLLDRRRLLVGSGALALAPLFPAWAQSGNLAGHGGHSRGSGPMAGRNSGGTLSGDTIALNIGEARYSVGRRSASAVAVNGTIPAPLIRLREGQTVRIAVTNHLKEQSSIHWHGLLVPFQMDGVPGLSFPGIDPGETFTYQFPILHSGTFWYHSHSGMQEAVGLYGPIVIDPALPDAAAPFDREYVLMLADWSPVDPHAQLRKLKTMGGYYNWQRQTVGGLIAGKDQSLKDRLEWAKMRMDATDISDVTGATYSFLVNGHDTEANWTALFRPGERVKLRIINASAMTNFNFRIPGLPMTVVAADGCNVAPVETDEIQIAIAETYDVIVQPGEAAPFGIIAEAIDRSGLVRATLAPQAGMVGPVPKLRQRPILTMRDMGMDMSGMDMGAGGEIDLSKPANESMDGHSMSMRDFSAAPGVKKGPGVATISPMPADRLADRGTGLENEDHRVLTYADLRSRDPNPDPRKPTRQIDVNLTANMERYMWSIDGETISDGAAPIPFRKGERVRVNLINHTMMPHPIHLHGHFFELVTGEAGNRPRKHTVNVLPGGKASFDLTADAEGDWAFHCHMLLHMHSGMMRVVTVRADKGDAA